MKPPLVIVEVGNTDGLPDPVVTKEDRVTLVSIDWNETPPAVMDEAISVLREYRGEHPRIDLVLERLAARRADTQ